ncbi:hypothetical protein ACB094_08G031700 [Castanea mollissima]
MDGREAQLLSSGSKHGGWITFPFIIGVVTSFTLRGGGWISNLTVYLIQVFSVKNINAAQISNIVNVCTNLLPVIGAIVANSFLGSFSVAAISACISLLGIILLTLTATLDHLRPQPCDNGSSLCTPPSKLQYTILYTSLALACIGSGRTRFTIATMGANQFNNPKDQGILFNWFIFTFYIAVVGNVSWKLGFGLCMIANFIGLAFILLGNRFYLHDKSQGSPFTIIVRVIVATIQKWKVPHSSKIEDYYYRHDRISKIATTAIATPKKSFTFLNRAALKTGGDVGSDGLITKPLRICTVQQVEDLKTLIKIFPLWSSNIFLDTPIGVLTSLTILQALTMDRHLGPHSCWPFFITIIDRFLCPMSQKLTHKSPTPLQQIGLGHVLNILSMTISALVESKRLKIAHAHRLQGQLGSIVPMLTLWLISQLVLLGIGEAFHFQRQVALYYQEFPTSLKSTATAMIAIIVGISFYMSTALTDVVRRVTGWLPNDINNGRLDNMYWLLVVVGVINFGCYLVCASLCKYQNVAKGDDSNYGTNK